MELYNGIVYGVTEEGSGLSVLRTFRLLRILKLVRFLPNLRRQLIVMLKTMDNVAVFFGLLALFIFIFRFEVLIFHLMNVKWKFYSILGMNLFGCKFCDPETGVCDRKNFDSLLWATVTVFQVISVFNRENDFGIVMKVVVGLDSGRLEHCLVCWHGENQSLGGSVLCSSDDFW